MIYLLILRTAEELAPSHRLGLPFRVDTDVIHRTIFVRFHRTWARFFFFLNFCCPARVGNAALITARFARNPTTTHNAVVRSSVES